MKVCLHACSAVFVHLRCCRIRTRARAKEHANLHTSDCARAFCHVFDLPIKLITGKKCPWDTSQNILWKMCQDGDGSCVKTVTNTSSRSPLKSDMRKIPKPE